MFNIKYKKVKKNSISYIGNTSINPICFKRAMEDLCKENDVCIFWQLKKDGEFFIEMEFCAAKICTGNFT